MKKKRKKYYFNDSGRKVLSKHKRPYSASLSMSGRETSVFNNSLTFTNRKLDKSYDVNYDLVEKRPKTLFKYPSNFVDGKLQDRMKGGIYKKTEGKIEYDKERSLNYIRPKTRGTSIRKQTGRDNHFLNKFEFGRGFLNIEKIPLKKKKKKRGNKNYRPYTSFGLRGMSDDGLVQINMRGGGGIRPKTADDRFLSQYRQRVYDYPQDRSTQEYMDFQEVQTKKVKTIDFSKLSGRKGGFDLLTKDIDFFTPEDDLIKGKRVPNFRKMTSRKTQISWFQPQEDAQINSKVYMPDYKKSSTYKRQDKSIPLFRKTTGRDSNKHLIFKENHDLFYNVKKKKQKNSMSNFSLETGRPGNESLSGIITNSKNLMKQVDSDYKNLDRFEKKLRKAEKKLKVKKFLNSLYN